MTIVDADYKAVIDDCRGHIANGTQPSGADIVKIIAVVKDAVDRFDAVTATMADMGTALDDLRTTWDAQIAILQAGGAGDISAEVDAADTAIETDLAAAETAFTALDADDPAGPSYWANAVADG